MIKLIKTLTGKDITENELETYLENNKVDLGFANLKGSDLEFADLTGANLFRIKITKEQAQEIANRLNNGEFDNDN